MDIVVKNTDSLYRILNHKGKSKKAEREAEVS